MFFFSQVILHRTKDPLDSLPSQPKKSSSLRHIFSCCQRKPKINGTISDDSDKDNYFSPPLKKDTYGDITSLQTYPLYTPTQSDKAATPLDNLSYEAESPDEAALVYAAKAYGFILLARTNDSVTVRLPSGDNLVFEVLDILKFDFFRKRMSILVRHPITKEYVLYTKGADYAIMELLGTPYAGMY